MTACCSPSRQLDSRPLGEMAERLNAPVLKTGVPVRVPRVRIPLSPLLSKDLRQAVVSPFLLIPATCATNPQQQGKRVWVTSIAPSFG